MTTVGRCVVLEQYRIQTDHIETLSKVAMSALEGFDRLGYRTARLDTLVDNINGLGLEHLNPTLLTQLSESISTEASRETRDNLVLLGIGARAQQIFDMIIGFILRLLGSRGQRPADMDIAISEEIRNIQEMTEERITKSRIPEFEHPQFKQNWQTQWTSYRDSISEVDATYKKMSPEDFYIKFSIPKNRDLYVVLGSEIMKRGIPRCYATGGRNPAFQRFIELIINTKNAISSLRHVEINEDGSVVYDSTGMDDLINNLESALDEDWDFASSGRPDWLTTFNSSGVNLLRKIDGDMLGLENVTRLLSRAIRIDERIKNITNNVPEDQRSDMSRTLNANIRDWTNHLNTLVRLIGTIYSRIKNAELNILKSIRLYRRTVDIIVKN